MEALAPVALIVAVVTSTAAVVVGVAVLGLGWRRLGTALIGVLDCLWAVLVFLVVNVVTTLGLIAVARVLGGESLSSYLAADVTLLIVSALQGIAFHLWRAAVRD